MGRPEMALGSGAQAEFARELRNLRRAAGSPTYRQMASLAHFSAATLSRAANGRDLPSIEVTRAYVQACAGDVARWESRWRALINDNSPGQPARNFVCKARQLPADVSNFVGRTEEISLVSSSPQWLSSAGTANIWAVSGPPGVGKTTYILHLGHLLKSRFPDCQLFADLHGTEGPYAEPSRILAQFLRALGVASGELPSSTEELSALYRSVLADRQCIILLDNAASEAQVAPLVPAGSASLVLVTSRYRLAGLSGARFINLPPLSASEATDLLCNSILPNATLTESEAEELVDLCGRLPLALRIIGARLATGAVASAAALIELLRDRGRRLEHLRAGSLSVQESFALSYRALPPRLQMVFRRLGLVPCLTTSVHVVARLTGLDVDQAAADLTALQQESLINFAGADRYAIHELLHLYAAERCYADDGPDDRPSTTRFLASVRAAGA